MHCVEEDFKIYVLVPDDTMLGKIVDDTSQLLDYRGVKIDSDNSITNVTALS